MTDGDAPMMVDEDAVLQQNKKGKGRDIPRMEQVKKSPVVEIVVPVSRVDARVQRVTNWSTAS
jgi:hypothetical protein